MPPLSDSGRERDDDVLAARVEALASWINELEARLRAAELATGDERTAKELRKAVEAVARHDPRFEERLTNRVDVVADRLETLASAVATTSAAIAAKDGDIVGVRRELAAGLARMGAIAADVRQTSRDRDVELRKALDALSVEHSRRRRGDSDSELARKLEYLGERVDTLATTVSETAAASARRAGELVQLRRETEAADARIAEALSEVRQAVDRVPVFDLEKGLAALAAQERTVSTMRARLEERDARTASSLDELRDAVADVSAALEERVAALERSPSPELGARFAELESTLAGVGTRLADLEASASGKLAAVVHATNEGRRELEDAVRRLVALEAARAADTHAVDDDRLRDLAAELAATRSRLEALSADVERALASPPPAAAGDGAPAAGPLPEWEAERAWVRRQLGALATMHASSPIAPSGEPAAEVRELTARVGALEAVRPAVGAGDRRFLLELRALELRLEQAEALARESHEAVLAQLDRIASRIEWRLLQLEGDGADPLEAGTATGGARVVPIRSGDA